jgi:molecular chaperone GrpE
MNDKKTIKTKDGSEIPQTDETDADDARADGRGEGEADTGQPGGTVSLETVKDLEDKLAAVNRQAEENYDRLLRVSADFENYKKRAARENEEFRKYATQSLVKDLLPVIDNLELALKSPAAAEGNVGTSLIDGVELTRREILRILENYQVKPIEALGAAFDPTYHEAVMREETDEHPENTVVGELQKGYLMHDRLIRPSMVVVSAPRRKNGSDGEDSGNRAS